MKTLLYATDLTASSENVALYAYRLAQTLKAKLLICHTLNVPAEIPQTGVVAWPLGVYEDMDRDSQRELAALKHKLLAFNAPGDHVPEIICVQGAGLVTEVVNREAVRHYADLIILGRHANDWFSTWLIGDHTRKLIETAVCPVLLVPGNFSFRPVTKIAFGSDFKHPELEITAISELVTLAQKLKAEVVLAHIAQKDESPTNSSIVKAVLTDLVRNYGHQQVSVKVVKSEQIAPGLIWLVRQAHIDLLAMVHSRHSFLGELFHHSYSQEVAGHTPVPLLIFNSHQNEK
ncbi:universal stress protein [Mucilaginibacter aquariorum]|uniref:Universal stress protein n=1 Tax=Mucilaginibacter aquariorum TaxID=2967225 RepID=A0ABT1T2S1_9SPHI|nr:universal stress protein [Mucilaginibacter aquariorum]MCQ6958715.1 universal stress protein [Mucilaginibacter aquariorum]